MKNWKEKASFFIVSVLIFYLSFQTMLISFSIPNPKQIIFPIVTFSLVAMVIKKYWVKIPIYLTIMISSLYFSKIVNEKPSMLLFVKHGRTFFEELHSSESFIYPLALTYFCLLIFLVILVEAFCVGQNIISVGLIIVSYLMFLSIFNDIMITKQILLILFLVLLLRGLQISKFKSFKFSLAAVVLLAVILTLSLVLPTTFMEKQAVTIASPYRNYLTNKGFYSYIANYKYGIASSTGFSEDDSELGGALWDDKTLQFKATQKNPHYWRIASKDIYTGKGWELSDELRLEDVDPQTAFILENGSLNNQEKEEIELIFSYSDKYVPVTYGKSTLDGVKESNQFRFDERTGRVELKNNANLNQIKMTVQNMDIPEDKLKQTATSYPSTNNHYTSLPENFPKKVKELAEEITKEKGTSYDKVLALQTYLKDPSNFRYSKAEVPYPRDNQDYVEQFLFETKVGYCDNFSTAMTVMLRSIDVPARWVKGFSTGSMKQKDGDHNIYEIRNLDAHSWVEVYFEGIGWVPFEPTPTFYQVRQVEQEKETTNKGNKETTPKDDIAPKKEQDKNKSKETTEMNPDVKKKQRTSFSFKKYFKIIFSVLGILTGIILLCLFKYRLYLYALVTFKHNKNAYHKVYEQIIKKANTKYYRKQEQPLMDYALDFEMKYPQVEPELSRLTKLYERELYNDETIFNVSHQAMFFKIIKELNRHK